MKPAPWGGLRWCVRNSAGQTCVRRERGESEGNGRIVLFRNRAAACQWIARQEAKR